MIYEPATTPSLGPQPGALALRDYAHSIGFADKGIYNNRSVRGGSSLSLHAEGRAVDLTHEGTSKTAEELTDLVNLLVWHHQALGIQQVIWWERVWTVGRTWRPYTGTSPHHDHAHVELTWHAAETLTVEHIAAVLEGDTLQQNESDALLNTHHFVVNSLEDPNGQPLDLYGWLASLVAKVDALAAKVSSLQAGAGPSAAEVVDEIKARL